MARVGGAQRKRATTKYFLKITYKLNQSRKVNKNVHFFLGEKKTSFNVTSNDL